MRKILLMALLSLFLDSVAFAYCGPLPRLICAEYSNSAVVAIAKLTQTEHFNPPDKQDWFIYTLETTKVLKGKVDQRFRVYEENSSGRAPFTWKKGESYLLFLSPGDDGTWWIYGCGNSRPVQESGSILKAIDSMGRRRGGLIQGLVRASKTGDPMGGVTVAIRGVEQSYKTATNKRGKFGIHVQAGHYEVEIVRTGWLFKRDEVDSLDDPANVQIESGGCAQVVIRGDLKQ